ncbi:hypothetical protein D3C81_289390 [compost metagenome]
MPVSFHPSNRTCSATPTDPSFVLPAPTSLAEDISVVHNSSRSFNPYVDSARTYAAAPAMYRDDVQIPLYCKGSKREGDLIDDLNSFSETWGALYEHLTTQILSEREVLSVLKSGILQRHMGKNLEQVFIEAMVRSTQPKCDMTAQRLREIFEAIFHLPPDQWAVEFGEHLNFSRSSGSHGVAGFIQAQLQLPREERDKKIASGELLTDAQWQRLCEVLEQSPVWMSERLEQADPNMPWMDLEDIPALRPSSAATQLLLGKCLQVMDEYRSEETAPSEYASQIRELIECIKDKSDPAVQLCSREEETAMFEFLAPTSRHREGTSDECFPLLSTLEEIERKSDFHPVTINANRVPKGLVAKAAYLLQIVNVSNFHGYPEKPHPKSIMLLPEKPSKPFIVKDVPVNPDTPPEFDIERKSVVPFASVEHALEMARQADALLTKITHTLTGWRPAEALDLEDPRYLLGDIAERLERLDIRTPFRTTPGSSFGSQENPYAETTEANADSHFTALGASLGAWLRSSAAHLGSMGVTMLAGVTHLTRQHPNASATLAFAAIHAALNEFYSRWFPYEGAGNQAHFAAEADPRLRQQIIDEVQLTLDAMPTFVQSVRARREASGYTNPHDDPMLVADVKSLMQQPAPSDPDMTVAELVDESIARAHYARLQISRMGVDIDGNPFVETEDVSVNSQRAESELGSESAEWVLDAMSDADITLHADRTLQARVVKELTSAGNTPMPVSTDSSIHKPASLFRDAVNDPKVLEWFESKGFALNTLKVFADSVSGKVIRDGVSSDESFSIWDDSGWWQVSAQVLIARQLLDPGDIGLSFTNEGPELVYRDVIIQFYGETSPTSTEEATELVRRLSAEGWPAFDTIKNDELLNKAKALIHEEKTRAQLSYELEQSVKNLADNAPVSLSSLFSRVANGSPLDEKCKSIVGHLHEFIALPGMISLCQRLEIDCTVAPVRISENRIQVLMPPALWYDITNSVSADSNLLAPFNMLLQQIKDTGNALYSTLSFDLQQTVNFRGFGSPKTAGEVRNVIRWLQTSLPTSMPLGDCGAGLLALTPSSATLTPVERTTIIGVSRKLLNGAASIIDVLCNASELDRPVEYRRDNAESILEDMLASEQSNSWAQQMLRELGWYGALEGQTASVEIKQQILLAAIKLAVDPDASGKPGTVAGYDVYQPKNLGRDVNEVLTEIERHLVQHKGVSERTAPLIAHLFLVDAAPEFLAYDIAKGVQVGTAGWMTLRLGVAIAETQKPGCSRAMTMSQLMDLALLTPNTPEQQMLFKTLAVDILVIWGVMNGIIPQRASYSSDDYYIAASKFSTQRKELAQAIEGFKRDLVTRNEIAIKELNKLYGPYVSVPIEDIKVSDGSTEKSFVEAYIDGDLSSAGWQMSNISMGRHTFDWFRIKLPDLDNLLTESVKRHFESDTASFLCATKSMIAALPLDERQSIELGEIRLFTLREETGRLKEDETAEDRAAMRGHQGVLLRCEYNQQVSYYEVFPGRMIMIKRTDLPHDLPLDGEIKTIKVKVSGRGPAGRFPIQRGTELPFDFSAYSEGAKPKAGATSEKLIVEQLGETIPAKDVSAEQTTNVPNSYFSAKTVDIAKRIVSDNFLQGYEEFLFKKAKGQTSAEENRAYWEKVKNFLLQLIPFVGCVDDLNSGKRMGFINGAFGCFTDLVSGLNALGGGVGKISSALRPVRPVSVKAFEAVKITGTTLVSMMNPLDGVVDMIAGGGRAITSFGKMLTTGVFALTESGISRLQTCVDRLRGYFGGFAAEAAARLSRQSRIVGVMGRVNSTQIVATLDNGKWYALDKNGTPVGRVIDNFVAPATAH